MSRRLRCPARACAWSAEIADVPPRQSSQHMPLLPGGGGWAHGRNRLGRDPTPHTVCSTRQGVSTALLQGEGQYNSCFHPLPSPSSQACLLGLAPWPHQIPLHGSAGTSSCFPVCPPDWGKSLTQPQIMSLHLAVCPGSPGDQTPFLRGCTS